MHTYMLSDSMRPTGSGKFNGRKKPPRGAAQPLLQVDDEQLRSLINAGLRVHSPARNLRILPR